MFVKLGAGEDVWLYTATSSVELIADVARFIPDGDNFTGLNPARLLDTRPSGTTTDGVSAGGGARPAGSTYELLVADRGGVPAGARAVVLNLTITEGSGPGYVSVVPCGQPTPVASSLNYDAGTTRANVTIADVDADGKVCLFTATSPVHLVVDVAGYFPGS